MDTVRYVHAADLHLDAAFKGALSQLEGVSSINGPLTNATFVALDRLVSLCERERPDFLVLAGDIYNQEDHSLKAQYALRDACGRLAEISVPVFIAHGNHDPLTSRLAAIKWPGNVVFFGAEMETHPVERDGRVRAIVHGISHQQPEETRNLARLFKRDRNQNCFQLGVLHCSLAGGAADRYAPCSKEDLIASGLDAWALGHVHMRQMVEEIPFIAYSGNTQGLHINEVGPKGCLLVTATPGETGWSIEADFHCLGPVLWEHLKVDLSGANNLDEVENLLAGQLEDLRASAPAGCQALVVRLILQGATDLDSSLRKPETMAILIERLGYLDAQILPVWIKNFEIGTRSPINSESFMDRDDLVGEVARICRRLAGNKMEREVFARKELGELYDNPRLRSLLSMPDGPGLETLLAEAERLCLEMLEKP